MEMATGTAVYMTAAGRFAVWSRSAPIAARAIDPVKLPIVATTSNPHASTTNLSGAESLFAVNRTVTVGIARAPKAPMMGA